MTINSIEALLRREEGEKLSAYQDHLGYWTIGVGILIDARKSGGITKEESTYLLQNRLRIMRQAIVEALPWSTKLDEVRFAVLQSMAFQMGVPGLLKFKNTLKLIEAGDYNTAANGMLNSLWAKQTPARAKRLSQQMAKGKWV